MARGGRTKQIEPYPEAKPGRCRVRDEGDPCARAASAAGVCPTHRRLILRRPDLDLRRFVRPPSRKTRYLRRDEAPPRECRVREVLPDDKTVDCRRPAASRWLCRRHGRVAEKRPEDFIKIQEATSSEKLEAVREGQLELRRVGQPLPGRCQVREVRGLDELACTRSPKSRNLCSHHYGLLLALDRKLFERIARPSRRRRLGFEVDPGAPAGRCRVKVDGEPCRAPTRLRSGLCRRHYATIRARDDLELAHFVLTPVIRYELRRKPVEGRCRVCERRGEAPPEDCPRKVRVRGLCKRHYSRFQSDPEPFRGIVLAPAYAVTLVRRSHPRPGRCEVAENGIGCSQPGSRARGICPRHRQMLQGRGLLDELFPRRERRLQVLGLRGPGDLREDQCRLTRDGQPCPRKPHWRGICASCIYLGRKVGLRFEDFQRASRRERSATLALRERPLPGVCRAIDGGEDCERRATKRGLCSSHYGATQQQGCFEALALSQEEGAATVPLPHHQLAPDVLAAYGVAKLLDRIEAEDSVRLVEEVLAGRRRGAVTTLGLRRAYARLGHRLAWSVEEGGAGMPPPEAEARARGFLRELFRAPDAVFHLLEVDMEELRCAILGRSLPAMSLPDALELRAHARALAESEPRRLATRDLDLLDHGQGLAEVPEWLLEPRVERNPRPGRHRCVVQDGRRPCPEPAAVRGICLVHHGRLKGRPEIERIRLPPVPKGQILTPQPRPRRGLCRTTVDGRPCPLAARTNGLCKHHYSLLHSRAPERLAEFTRPLDEVLFRRRKGDAKGRCRIRELHPGGGSWVCDRARAARGLCTEHLATLSAWPWLLDQLADLTPGESRLRRHEDPEPGICPVVEARVACTAPLKGKALVCMRHHRRLQRAGLLESWKDVLEPPLFRFAAKAPALRLPNVCGLEVHGIPCWRRALPDGACKRCHTRAARAGVSLPPGLLEEPCAPVATGGTASEPEASRHFFLDKNVVLDFARSLMGWQPSVAASPQLVREVLHGKVRATVSEDCPRALYSWLRHELEEREGIDPGRSEPRARAFVAQLFFGEGAAGWSFAAAPRGAFLACLDPERHPGLSLEDAWELEAARAVQGKPDGPSVVVTSDAGFRAAVPEATTHPAKVT